MSIIHEALKKTGRMPEGASADRPEAGEVRTSPPIASAGRARPGSRTFPVRRPFLRGFRRWGVPAAVCAAAVLTFVWLDIRSGPPPAEDEVRPVSGRASVPDYRLTGIIWDQDGPLAFLNEQLVRPGDSVDGVRVVEIRNRGIVIETASGPVSLELP